LTRLLDEGTVRQEASDTRGSGPPVIFVPVPWSPLTEPRAPDGYLSGNVSRRRSRLGGRAALGDSAQGAGPKADVRLWVLWAPFKAVGRPYQGILDPAVSDGWPKSCSVTVGRMDRSAPDPGPVNRALIQIIHEASEQGVPGPLDLDARMEAMGGEAAKQWRDAGASWRSWEMLRKVETAYWITQDVRHVKLHTVAILQIAETTLSKTTLTPEHRQHGWSERLAAHLASKIGEFREQVETNTFSEKDAGYILGRTLIEEVSPKWPDTDDLHVAVNLASEALSILSARLGIGSD